MIPNPYRKYITIQEYTKCWEWNKSFRYGRPVYNDRTVYRILYRKLVGKIPHGLELDHLCKNRICCNPSHLEPVTGEENRRRYREAPYRFIGIDYYKKTTQPVESVKPKPKLKTVNKPRKKVQPVEITQEYLRYYVRKYYS